MVVVGGGGSAIVGLKGKFTAAATDWFKECGQRDDWPDDVGICECEEL